MQCFLSFQIGDLGLSKVKQQTQVSGGVRGTLPWMAPELLSGKSNLVTDKVIPYFSMIKPPSFPTYMEYALSKKKSEILPQRCSPTIFFC